jgi:hypothetical protein
LRDGIALIYVVAADAGDGPENLVRFMLHNRVKIDLAAGVAGQAGKMDAARTRKAKDVFKVIPPDQYNPDYRRIEAEMLP